MGGPGRKGKVESSRQDKLTSREQGPAASGALHGVGYWWGACMYVVMVMSWNQSTHCENLVQKIQYQLGIVCFGLGRPQYRDPSRHAGKMFGRLVG